MKVFRTLAFLLVAMSLVLAACAPAATEAPVVTTEAAVSYTHLRAHETVLDLVCRLLLETKTNYNTSYLLTSSIL